MAIPFKKYGYSMNPITDEIKTPQVFLVNKQLKKIGELYPIENLSVSIHEVNQPDEVSFTYYKETNDRKSPYFDQFDDLSVIQVGDFGFFECSISKNQNTSIVKSVTAQSLGYSELSQILHTLEVNTDDDMNRGDYNEEYPTVFYRNIPIDSDEEQAKKLKESSLLHRILTAAPHYKIGDVSPTLKYVQRTFSWSDRDIISILHDIEQEVTCIFDIQVRIGEDGNVERIINAYDMQYCERCWKEAQKSGTTATSNTSTFRNIINGICQNCNESAHVVDIGCESGIYISTDNLSDDISICGDKDSIKNCFRITGGDDLMTNTVQGLNLSASGKIMAFSDFQKKMMSKELIAKLEQYADDYNTNIGSYEKLLETEYNAYDIRLYLQSGKMPDIEKEIKTTDEALYFVLDHIYKYFNNQFYISSYDNYYKYPSSSAKTSISNLFTTFMPEGFSMTIDKSDNEDDIPEKDYDSNHIYRWYGTIKFYNTGNRDDSYTLHITKSEGTYITSGTSTEKYLSGDTAEQNLVDNFIVQFYFADQSQQEYKKYIEQYSAYLLSTVDLSYENERKKEWEKYGYNLLKSYADGYQKCIETIDDLLRTTEKDSEQYTILMDTRSNYVEIQNDILLQMNVLEDQIFAVCSYLGGDYDDDYLNDKGEISYSFKYYKGENKASIQEIFEHMISSVYAGGYDTNQTVYTPNEFIGTKPCLCLKCNSTNVAVSAEGNICRNPGCGAAGDDIYTYCDIMKNISDSYEQHEGQTLVKLRSQYQDKFETRTYFGDTLYTELLSHIREDIYDNSNFTSDRLSNAQIIQQAKELKAKAEQELAKACTPQYEITTPLSSIVAQKSFMYQGILVNDDYSQFKINNYVRVKIDNDLYKMRITSINLQFPVTDKIDVTFSNVTNCKTNTAMSVKEILDHASSMATSYDYVAAQADKGAVANDQFVQIKNEGLNASLMNVINSRDQDVVIDSHGILLRKKIPETGEYSQYQTKLIDRNIVMTDDNWNTPKLAIGLGMYNGALQYGVWADVICGDLLAGNQLKIYGGGDGTADNATVIIDGKGITLDGGAITWINKGVTDTIEVYYAVSSSNTTHPAESSTEWNKIFTGTLNNNYLWSKTVAIDTVGKKTITYNCLGNSPDGIKTTKKQYYLSISETSATGGSWTDYQPTWAGSGYVWTRTYIEYISGKTEIVGLVYDSGLTKSLRDFSTFKSNVDTALGKSIPTTEIGSDYVISPKIGGGYLYIASGDYSVEIDPNHKAGNNTLDNWLFVIRNKNVNGNDSVVMGVNTDGDGYFNGEIYSTSGNFGGWQIDNGRIYSTDKSKKLSTILYAEGRLYINSEVTDIVKEGSIYIQNKKLGSYLNISSSLITLDDDYTYSGDTSLLDISINNPTTNSPRFYINSRMKTYIGNCEHLNMSGEITLPNNNYIRTYKPGSSNKTALIGWSNGDNIWIGYWNNSPVYAPNSIYLNARNIYYTGNAPHATSSDKRIKSDIDYIEKAKEFILNLEPKQYKLADSTSNRKHMGFIAQDVEKVMLKTIGDTGLVVKQTFNEDVPINFDDDNTYTYALRYEEFIAPIVATIQSQHIDINELKEIVANQTNIINKLKNKI